MKRLLITTLVGLILIAVPVKSIAQNASVSEQLIEMKTYPFSEPDPVPAPGRIFPYFYFNGYTNKAVMQKWKMVVLENEYVKVYVCPDIGGKIWGAIEKSTGMEFLYFNNVVKFRDVAMRGPWTSGGLEYNFGDIGHIPTCATPVDYTTRTNSDGSVSCITGAIDLPSGTRWNVETIVRPGEAFFETKVTWFNNTSIPVTYYHWMNAAAKAEGDLEFIYPGSHEIGHGGELGEWPVQNGRNLSFYKNNNFGTYKSYHVINSYSDFFGGYWHDDNFGFGHGAAYDDKPGKKLWIWGLAQEGMIWESLLTDNDGQYIEFQAGKLFNQAAENSTVTPFKHKEFAPHDADVMSEYWFPLKGTGGMVAASRWGVLNAERNVVGAELTLSALRALDDDITVFINGKLQKKEKLNLKPLELYKTAVSAAASDTIEVVLGDRKLYYTSAGTTVTRPVTANSDFDHNSVYGKYVNGLELEKQRKYSEALELYLEAIKADRGYLPAINRLALGHYRRGEYNIARSYIDRSLGIDTYDGEANYLLGLIARKQGDIYTSKSGFGIAMGSVNYRSAAATELATAYFREHDYRKTEEYAEKALSFNIHNIEAMKLMALASRKKGDFARSASLIAMIGQRDETSHFARFEQYLLNRNAETLAAFTKHIRNELPDQSYLDLAISYHNLGCTDEAVALLKLSPANAVANLWLAGIDTGNRTAHLKAAVAADPSFVFPFRVETGEIIEKLMKDEPHWVLKYYLGLIYWNSGRTDEASELFRVCGQQPGFAPFYLSRAKLLKNDSGEAADLKKAAELAPRDWRPALALATYHLEHGDGAAARAIIEPFVKLFPEQSSIGVCYAKSLNALGLYEDCINFLTGYVVLPFEGATITRDIFHEACLRAAFAAFEKKSTSKAVKLLEKSAEWPVNLGAGKPYDVDERMANFLLGYIYAKTGKKTNSMTAYSKVAGYERYDDSKENSALLLTLEALRKTGKEDEAEKLIDKYSSKYPGNDYIKWAILVFRGEKEQAGKLKDKILNGEKELAPYDTRLTDKFFRLLLDLQVLTGI
jgi:tetratricopeptide (TPR) repeat protein